MSPRPGADAARVHKWFVRLAVASAALMFVVIVASAYLRHWQAGLACPDWPACYGRVDVEAVAAPPLPVRAARLAHRLAASSVLVAIAGLLLVAWTQAPRRPREGTLAAIAFALALGLAALGVATPGSLVPAVALGNLLGGYAILALLAAVATLARAPAGGPKHAVGTRASAALCVVLGFAVAAAVLGGAIGARFALAQCAAPGTLAAALASLDAVAPFEALRVVAGRIAPPAAAAGLCSLHGAAGAIVALAAIGLAFVLRRAQPALAWPLTALALATSAAGALALAARPSLPLTQAHNALAALLIAALAAGAVRYVRLPTQRRARTPAAEPAA